MRRSRVTLAAVLAVVATLAVSSCAPPRDAGWRPPDAQVSGATAAELPAPLGQPPHGAVGQRIRSDDVRLQARWFSLPAVPELAQHANDLVWRAVTLAEDQSGADYEPEVGGPELFVPDEDLPDRDCTADPTVPANEVVADPDLGTGETEGTALTCTLVAANGPYLGQLLRVVSVTDDAVTDSATALYADVAQQQVFEGTDLWRSEAATRLWRTVVSVLRAQHGSLSLADPPAPSPDDLGSFQSTIASSVPTPDGGVTLTVPTGFAASPLEAIGAEPTTTAMTVTIGADTALPLLSEQGRALVTAVAEGDALDEIPTPGFGADTVDCTLVPCVALTYDDGPSELTPDILDAAAEYNAGLTFFVVGEKVDAFADVLRREIAEGHVVENHTWNHPDLTTLDPDEVRDQVRRTAHAIEKVTGERPDAYRPPYGAYNDRVLEAAGIPAVLWSYDTFDWQHPPAAELIARAVENPVPGTIVLQHDIQQVTGETVRDVYRGLTQRGFALVTIRQLLGDISGVGVWSGEAPSGPE